MSWELLFSTNLGISFASSWGGSRRFCVSCTLSRGLLLWLAGAHLSLITRQSVGRRNKFWELASLKSILHLLKELFKNCLENDLAHSKQKIGVINHFIFVFDNLRRHCIWRCKSFFKEFGRHCSIVFKVCNMGFVFQFSYFFLLSYIYYFHLISGNFFHFNFQPCYWSFSLLLSSFLLQDHFFFSMFSHGIWFVFHKCDVVFLLGH